MLVVAKYSPAGLKSSPSKPCSLDEREIDSETK